MNGFGFNFGFSVNKFIPSAFFRDKTGQPLSTTITSNKIKLPTGGVLTITGGTFSIDGGEFGTTGTAEDGAIIVVQVVSSAEYETAIDGALSVDGVLYDTFTVTTMAEVITPDWTNRYNNTDHYTGSENYA